MSVNDKGQLVSIAMPVYNGARFLAEQLDSLLAQTYPFIEIIITDDCSTDNTLDIVREYQQKHPNIFLYQNEVNCGVSKTFEHCIHKCNGSYVALCDQDDIWMKEKITLMLEVFGKEDAVYCNSVLVNEKGDEIGMTFKQIMNMQSYYSGEPFLLGNCVPGHTLLIKKDFLKMVLPFPVTVFYDRWISFCAAGNNGIRYLDIPLVKYRQHSSNTIGIRKAQTKENKKKKPPTQSLQQKFHAKLIELQTFAKAPISSQQTKSILNEMIKHFHLWPSLARCIFFFKNIDTILLVKSRPYYRKVLYCLKMFFRPNY